MNMGFLYLASGVVAGVLGGIFFVSFFFVLGFLLKISVKNI